MEIGIRERGSTGYEKDYTTTNNSPSLWEREKRGYRDNFVERRRDSPSLLRYPPTTVI